ncbi:MAG TPA: serine--tRNA ligase [bacterium]|nr:serine--tRNA ligase [bacterium]
MLDLRLIRERPDELKAAIRRKGADPGLVDAVLEADRRRRDVLTRVEALRAAQNRASQEIPRLTGAEREARIAEMKRIATELRATEPELAAADAALETSLRRVPNPPHPGVPDGGPEASVTLRTFGEPPHPAFEMRDHVDLGTRLDMLDMERGAKVSGSRFAILRRDGALLEMALFRYAVDRLTGRGFVPVIPPVLVKREAVLGTMGGAGLDEQMVYRIEGEDLALAGTSEVALGAMLAGEVLDEADLPIRLVGISTCFRREAGTHGKDTRGMFRVHQFDKVEMFSFCHPDRSWDEHTELVGIQESLWQGLGLPYRVVDIAAGDLGDPAARKYDIETWMPGRGGYAETQSCSNCTDYQARRLNVRFRTPGQRGLEYVHTLNGTAVASTRAIIAIMENFQDAGSGIKIPPALRPYMDGRTEIAPPRPMGPASAGVPARP